jgi:hypothetical protein
MGIPLTGGRWEPFYTNWFIKLYFCLIQNPFDGGKNEEQVVELIKTKPLEFPNKTRNKQPVDENEDRTNFIKGLLQRDISQRLGCSNEGLGFETDIKVHPFLKVIDWELLRQKKLQPKIKPKVFESYEIDKDAMNFSANLLIEDMLGAEQLSYKPRKKKRDPNSLSLSQKLSNSIGNLFGIKSNSEDKLQQPKPKTKEQIDMEQMDQFWTDFDYELPNQKPMVLPSSSKKPTESKQVSKSTDNLAADSKKERMNQSMGDLSASGKGKSSHHESESQMSRNSSIGKMDKSRPNSASLTGVDDTKQKQNRSPLREAITAGEEEDKDFVQQLEQEFNKLGSQHQLNAPNSESNSIDKDRVLAQ